MDIVSSPDKQRTELEEKRKQYLSVLTFVFDRSFPIVFDNERLDRAIKDSITQGKNYLDLIITPSISAGIYALSLEDHVRDACSKKILGIFPQQIEYRNVNLNDLRFDLGHFDIYDYENVVSDVLDESTELKTFKDNYNANGYEVEIIKHLPGKSDCTIRLIWDKKK